jgi:hypothetical protein
LSSILAGAVVGVELVALLLLLLLHAAATSVSDNANASTCATVFDVTGEPPPRANVGHPSSRGRATVFHFDVDFKNAQWRRRGGSVSVEPDASHNAGSVFPNGRPNGGDGVARGVT